MPIVMNYIMTGIVINDIFMSINTGFYEKGVCITDRKLILKNYLKNYFFTDMIAVWPQVITL